MPPKSKTSTAPKNEKATKSIAKETTTTYRASTRKKTNPNKTTKTDLIISMAQAQSISKAEASKRLDLVLSTITDALSQGQSIVVTGFGTFERRIRKARVGKNSLTGQENYQFPESRSVGFKCGKALKSKL